MDVSFRRSVVFFSQITWGITQILLTETVEMLRRREIELVDNVRKRDIRPVSYTHLTLPTTPYV